MELEFQARQTRHFVENKWIDLREETFTMPDGTLSPPYYTYSRKNYVVIVATDEAGRYLCVRQFRPGLGKVTTEFPAGGIDRPGERQYGPADSEQEDPLLAAKRELREETGYVSEDWEALIAVPSQATMADNWAWIYRARNCRPAGGQRLDDAEFLNVLALAPDELERRIREGGFEQAVHIMAWALDKLKNGS